MSRSQSTSTTVATLTRMVTKLQPDAALQYSEPERWSRAADVVTTAVDRLVDGGKQAEAAKVLTRAHEIFSTAGLRALARMTLGHLARLSDDPSVKDVFHAVAGRELREQVDYRAIPHASLRVSLAATELESWAAHREALKADNFLVWRLTETIVTLLDDTSLSWREAARRHLWRIHLATSSLATFAGEALAEKGRNGRELTTAARYLADYVHAVADPTSAADAPTEAPIRALAFTPAISLAEFLDLSAPARFITLRDTIRRGGKDEFRSEATALADAVGRLVCKLHDPEQVGRAFLKMLHGFRDCWSELSSAPSGTRGGLVAAQVEPVAVLCDGLALALRWSQNSDALVKVANDIEDFARARYTKQIRAPGTCIAPLWLVAGELLDRAAEIAEDTDLEQRAGTMYIEAGRLLTLTQQSPYYLLADALRRIETLERRKPLEQPAECIPHLARAYMALADSDFAAARKELELAGKALADSLSDPDIMGFRNLTLQAGRVWAEAADIASQTGDRAGSIANLTTAAATMEDAARRFKIQEDRERILQSARSYRDIASKRQATAATTTPASQAS